MVHGINCDGCKTALTKALSEVDGVTFVAADTKANTGVHPNLVVVTGTCDERDIRDALAQLDAGRAKFTIDADAVAPPTPQTPARKAPPLEETAKEEPASANDKSESASAADDVKEIPISPKTPPKTAPAAGDAPVSTAEHAQQDSVPRCYTPSMSDCVVS